METAVCSGISGKKSPLVIASMQICLDKYCCSSNQSLMRSSFSCCRVRIFFRIWSSDFQPKCKNLSSTFSACLFGITLENRLKIGLERRASSTILRDSKWMYRILLVSHSHALMSATKAFNFFIPSLQTKRHSGWHRRACAENFMSWESSLQTLTAMALLCMILSIIAKAATSS